MLLDGGESQLAVEGIVESDLSPASLDRSVEILQIPP